MKFLVVLILGFSQSLLANSIDWTGTYRFEGIYVDSANLDSDSNSYFLHHLILKPSIVAADGMHIKGQFHILNNDDAYANVNNQIGSFLGDSPYSGSDPSTLNSRTLNESQSVSFVQVSQLYLHWLQEYGSLIVGRAPKDFGLGLNYSAGKGLFDHWLDTHDVIAYDFLVGNISFKPYYAKVESGSVNKNTTDTQEVGIVVSYENLETDLKMGAYYEERKNSSGVENDGSTPMFGGDPAKAWGSYKHKNWNLFVSKAYENFGFAFEIGFNAGNTGVMSPNNEKIEVDAFAVVSEIFYNLNKTWSLKLDAGMLTGDDPETTGKYEGYLSDRNYDIALLLFNHKIGQLDVSNTDFSTYSSADVDSARLSNAIYFAPGIDYNISDKWQLRTKVIIAKLMEDPRGATNADTDLGIELDVGVSYKPIERVAVKFDFAYLEAGDAFKGGTNNYPVKSILGFETGLAVSF